MVFAPSLAFQRSISLQLWGVQRCWGQGQTLPAPSSTSSCGCFYLQATSSVRGCECYHKWPLCPVQGNRPQDMCFYETVTPQTVSERQLRWDSWKIMSIIWRPVPDVLVDSGPISISQHLRVWSAWCIPVEDSVTTSHCPHLFKASIRAGDTSMYVLGICRAMAWLFSWGL